METLETDFMSYDQAIICMKQGHKVRHDSWEKKVYIDIHNNVVYYCIGFKFTPCDYLLKSKMWRKV